MNKEFLEKRIQEIKVEMEILKTHYAKLEGHLAESLHWFQKSIEDTQLPINKGLDNGEVNNESTESAS